MYLPVDIAASPYTAYHAPAHSDGRSYNDFSYAGPSQQQYVEPQLSAMTQIHYHQYHDYMHPNEHHYPYHNNDVGRTNFGSLGYTSVINNNGTAVLNAPQSAHTNGVNYAANIEPAADPMSLSQLADMEFGSRVNELSLSMDEIKL